MKQNPHKHLTQQDIIAIRAAGSTEAEKKRTSNQERRPWEFRVYYFMWLHNLFKNSSKSRNPHYPN